MRFSPNFTAVTVISLKNSDTWKVTCFVSILLSVLLSNFISLFVLLYRWNHESRSLYTDPYGTHVFDSYNSFIDGFGWKRYNNGTNLRKYDTDISKKNCQIVNCFDISRCTTDFKVYIYPPTIVQAQISITYSKILLAIRRSNWFTENPSEACLFVPNLDTLDRDGLSSGFSSVLASQLVQLPYWYRLPEEYQQFVSEYSSRPGLNHLIFNFYSGTWPDYLEDDHQLPLGYALLAKTSFSTSSYRINFDISFPLIHSFHREKNTLTSCFRVKTGTHSCHTSSFLQHRPILLSFKGKRYVSGIGSVTRNSLIHLRNGHSIILLTTCQHGADWMRFADHRCVTDQTEYDKYDYNELLQNSTFCLIPRGRRLGSYRFLEALQAGCIPVILSNDWILPFSDVIDWRRAALRVDERLLLTLPTILRRISYLKVVQLRQQVAFLWKTYFSSVDSIVLTTLEIIRNRIFGRPRGYIAWNSPPGALILSHTDFLVRCDLSVPYLPTQCNNSTIFTRFTMIVPIRDHLCQEYRNRLGAYAHSVLRSPSLDKVLLVWQCPTLPPNSVELPGTSVNFELVLPDERRQEGGNPPWMLTGFLSSPSSRFQASDEINTSAVFAFSLNVNLTAEQVEFAFGVWRQFPNRLVGFLGHGHRWDQPTGLWHYLTNISGNKRQQQASYSVILLNAAFYHRYYHRLYWRVIPRKLLDVVDIFADCEDLLLNALIGHFTQSPPIKLLDARQIDGLLWSTGKPMMSGGSYQSHRSTCLQAISQHLVDSITAVPPSLFYSACHCNLEVSASNNRTPVVVRSPIASSQKTQNNYLYLPLFQSSLT